MADKDKDRAQLTSILTALMTMVGGAAAAPLAQGGAIPQPRPTQTSTSTAWNPQAAPQPQPQPQRPAVYPQGNVQLQPSRPAPLYRPAPPPRPSYPAVTSQAAPLPQPQRPAVYPRGMVQPQPSRPVLGTQLATQPPLPVTSAPAAPPLPVCIVPDVQAQAQAEAQVEAQSSAGNSAPSQDIVAAPMEASVRVLPSSAVSVASESTAGAQPALQNATGTRRGMGRERKPPAAHRDYAAGCS